MLHILWIMIKFILILLAVLAGLLLLGILLVLFCPVRYRAAAGKQEADWKQAEADGYISWLFRGVGLKISLREGGLSYSIRILGIPLEKLRRKKESPVGKTPAKNRKKKSGKPRKATPHPTSPQHPAAPQNPTAPSPSKAPEVSEQQPLSDEAPKQQSPPDAAAMSQTSPISSAAQPPLKKEPAAWIPRIRGKLKAAVEIPLTALKKLAAIPSRILKKLRKIKITTDNIYEKITWWKQFLSNPRTKAALALVRKEAKGLIRHILPTRIRGNITFGCEDPALTGTALALLGISFPFHKNRIAVTPLFDGENTLTGDVDIKGRIYGIILVKTAIELYFNKNIKYTINRWKHKED